MKLLTFAGSCALPDNQGTTLPEFPVTPSTVQPQAMVMDMVNKVRMEIRMADRAIDRITDEERYLWDLWWLTLKLHTPAGN